MSRMAYMLSKHCSAFHQEIRPTMQTVFTETPHKTSIDRRCRVSTAADWSSSTKPTIYCRLCGKCKHTHQLN